MAILTEHQRKMTKLRLQANGSERIGALEWKVAELATLVHEQTIALDNLSGSLRAEPERIEQRIGR